MKSKSSILITALVILTITVNIIPQIIIKINPKYITETVYECVVNKEISVEGIVFRDESIISSAGNSGIVKYNYDNGSKVAKGSEVAAVYGSEADVINEKLIASLESEIELLKSAQDLKNSVGTGSESFTKQAYGIQNEIVSMLQKGNANGIKSLKKNMLGVLSKSQIVTGKIENFNNRINELMEKKESLQVKEPTVIELIKAVESGYFVHDVDGFETVFNLNDLENISVASLEEMFDKKGSSAGGKYVGKLILSNRWMYAALSDYNDALLFSKDADIKLDFFNSEDKLIKVNFENIITGDGESKAVILFSCELMNNEISYLRKNSAKIIFGEIKGIKVPKSAVRFNNEEKGAYILIGDKPVFKKLDIILEDADYVISAIHSELEAGGKNYVQIFDKIIIKGKDLSGDR